MEAVNDVMNNLACTGNDDDENGFEDFPEKIASAMALTTLKNREKGLDGQDTKAMSLKARYFLKAEGSHDLGRPQPLGELRRDTLVVVKGQWRNGVVGDFYYRVLCV
jgi:hypothetical protein